MALPLFPSPTLLGLGYNVVRRPKGSTSVQTHVSGREVRVGYWANTMWEWELTFDVLRDFQRGVIPNVVPSELKRLQGHFLAAQGSLTGFPFEDPDDSVVVGQFIGTTDGNVNTIFTLVRTYGDVGYGATGTEPIGTVDVADLTVYLDGIPQTVNVNYAFNPTVPYDQRIYFLSGQSGNVITVDMTYQFWVRYDQDTLDFEKFSGPPGAAYWRVKKLKLVSLRG